jgi:hypothetical protein
MHVRPAPARGVRLNERARPARPVLAAVLAALAALMAAGCGPRAVRDVSQVPELVLAWSLSPAAPVVGPATLRLALTDVRAGRRLGGATIEVEEDMLHPGMAPILAVGREVAPGRYEADLRFSMAGDWVLLVDATLADGRPVHREIRVRGVRPA